MRQGSSIPHSCLRMLYNRLAPRIRFPNSSGEGLPSKSSNTSNSFHHVYRGGAALVSHTLPRCADYDLISRGWQCSRTIPKKAPNLAPRFVLLYRNLLRDATFISALQGKEEATSTRYHSGAKMPGAAQFILECDYDFRDNI